MTMMVELSMGGMRSWGETETQLLREPSSWVLEAVLWALDVGDSPAIDDS